jgi:soluble lytic murein transglycosylase-like protein
MKKILVFTSLIGLALLVIFLVENVLTDRKGEDYYRQKRIERVALFLKIHAGNLANVKKNYGPMIREKARQKGVPEKLALAIASSESGGNPRAINTDNADGSIDRGLFQLNDRGLGHGFSEADLFDPEVNTEIALTKLAELIKKYGDLKTGLIAYQIGPSRVDSLMKIKDFNKEHYSLAAAVLALAEKA